MSSLAATQADGYYLPPEYYASGAYRKLTRNQWEAKQRGVPSKPKQTPVVRFELPCSGTCQGCGHFVMKGTRYNAEKIKTGDKYLSSVIWEFRMTCRNCCETLFVIRTNPQQQGFDYLQGIKKQQRHNQEEQRPKFPTGNASDSEEEEKYVLGKLEQMARGKRKTMSEMDQLRSLKNNSERCFLQDSDTNAAIRASFRVERKHKKRRRKAAEALGFREGISLADHTTEDEVTARETTFGNCKATERKKLRDARTSSIFAASTKSKKKKRTASRRKRTSNGSLEQSANVVPDEIPSSSPQSKCTFPQSNPATPACLPENETLCSEGEMSSDQGKRPTEKKKIFITQKGNACSLSTSATNKEKHNHGSALAALADYASDSS